MSAASVVPTTRVFLLGLRPFDSAFISALRGKYIPNKIAWLGHGTVLGDLEPELNSEQGIDVVIMGAGIDLDLRLDIIKTIFESSKKTSVHMKDRASGRMGFPTFVHEVLTGLGSAD